MQELTRPDFGEGPKLMESYERSSFYQSCLGVMATAWRLRPNSITGDLDARA